MISTSMSGAGREAATAEETVDVSGQLLAVRRTHSTLRFCRLMFALVWLIGYLCNAAKKKTRLLKQQDCRAVLQIEFEASTDVRGALRKGTTQTCERVSQLGTLT
jgi:hypothetical protein